MKILVIRLSSFGDIVLSYTFLYELRKLYPDSQISFLTRAQYSELIKMNPYVDDVLEYEENTLWTSAVNIYKNKYDKIFDLHKNIKSYILSVFVINKVNRLKKETFRKALLVLFKINLLSNFKPVFEKYLSLLDTGTASCGRKFRILTGFKSGTRLIKENYTVIAPSSKHFTKRLPKEIFEQIINSKRNELFVLTGDKSSIDNEICSYLESNCKNTINLQGNLSFRELADLIFFSEYVICNDSGIMHLAEALDKKVTVFFGSTVKEFGFFPQLTESDIREVTGLECRPCTRIGKNKCPKKHFKCMNNQSISK
jgi:heptosyltransferase-2